mmetsp:Transcript_25277/g.63401  ORF Transcript_25277/g.63401 Transcript_25277/m.63401 type:complete len:339 (+) Transcript_25277:189-1205(+)|eukprot:CAMPEP_0177646444 /NCGR_PEP_ID=MMETSP0447-20121125/9777_1 /TAXON_ID=0 /ORGANISM="Stygamoeba regulata, Strain BSH-02190019" /LENGTH=338 /DNA_ID=CAMNT_0019148977 /DNA_START=184 /DNA_END=1200 /DNA_ORIENTATION=+
MAENKHGLCQGISSPEEVENSVDQYMNLHKADLEERKMNYETLVDKYYSLATDFYEYGWGRSFHFAVRAKNESFYASLARHEHWLAMKMQLKPGQKVLDAGCGVGGPARSIARFADVYVTGVTLNEYQVQRAKYHTQAEGLTHLVTFQQGNFMKLPFEDNTFDAVYECEATAHAPDKAACYAELMRVVKPGGFFGSYEWCMTDKYDPNNAEHRAIKKGIEEGDGLPDIATTEEVDAALEKAGWVILEKSDRALECKEGVDTEWYEPLVPKYTPSNIQHTWIGKAVMARFLKTLEFVRVLPKGTLGVSDFLNTAASSLVAGGQTGTFTPMYFTLCQKPL